MSHAALHPMLADSSLGKTLHDALARDEVLRNPQALREVEAVTWEAFGKLHGTDYHATACEFGHFAIVLREEIERLEGRGT
jgi:hypothetical protein